MLTPGGSAPVPPGYFDEVWSGVYTKAAPPFVAVFIITRIDRVRMRGTINITVQPGTAMTVEV